VTPRSTVEGLVFDNPHRMHTMRRCGVLCISRGRREPPCQNQLDPSSRFNRTPTRSRKTQTRTDNFLVQALESLLRACENELQFLHMSINLGLKKSPCIRNGHRHNVTCASITTCHGQPLHWVYEFRYFFWGGEVFIVSSQSYKCSLVCAKRSFYAAVNGLFGKLLNLASEK